MEHVKVRLADLPLELRWYDAAYVQQVRSIFPKEDISQELAHLPRDVLILEEPEHLCWYHNGQRWPELFKHVVGVVHTNYQVYLDGMGYEGFMSNTTIRDSIFLTFTSLVLQAYCDVTIRLSNSGPALPNEVVGNIHAVRDEFLEVGREVHEDDNDKVAAYFLGKAVFPKGWMQLLQLLSAGGRRFSGLRVDAYGSGPDWNAIQSKAEELQKNGGAHLRVFKGLDHAATKLHDYKILVNASTSEMLCTVTLEALAMRKRVVLPRHSSNAFFEEHFADRCHFFIEGDVKSFEEALRQALSAGWPAHLNSQAIELLSWDNAVERLCEAAEVRVLSGTKGRPSEVPSARFAYEVHRNLQRDLPSLSNLLKDATLKSRTPWEDLAAQIRATEYGELFLGAMERRV